MKIYLSILLIGTLFLVDGDFKRNQKRYSRVRDAYTVKDSIVDVYYNTVNVKRSGAEVIIVGYKDERKLEVWTKNSENSKFVILKEYPFCAFSGELGPKRKQGDWQIPEGLYYINRFNPSSSFHLSLGINYPNSSDKKLSSYSNLGGDIFIHGDCVTIGCIPLTDDLIKELYIICVDAKDTGESKIPVYLFPFKMNSENFNKHTLDLSATSSKKLFWDNLKVVYSKWNSQQNKLSFEIDNKGYYQIL